MSKTNGKTSAASAPRLCHVIKVEDFDGYGFNLHAEKGKPGQYIGKVDDGSPAERANLRQGDRIIEVNAVNIGRETHKEVVQRIKAIANEVQLLVVDTTVQVTKDNRLVDPLPVIKSSSQPIGTPHWNDPDPDDEPATGNASSSITPDIVVQLPSTPSSPIKDNSAKLNGGRDVTDHVAHNQSVPSSPVAADKSSNGGEDIIAIKINNEAVPHPITVNASKTSTFSTSPKSHASSTFVSTASFNTSETEPIKEATATGVSTVTVTPPPPKSPPPSTTPTYESEPNIPSVTSSSASPPSSPRPVVAPTVPIVSTTHVTSTTLTNGSATSSPPPPTSASNGSNGSTGGSGLNLNMTVAELRAKLAAKKKFDPKAGSVDLRKKYEIVEKL